MAVLVDDNNELAIDHMLETFKRKYGLFTNKQEALDYLIK